MIPVLERSAYLSVILLIATILAFSTAASAGDVNPLRPVDTSSPRATLEDFVVTMDGAYRGMKVNMQEYAASRRLYPTADERRRRAEIFFAAAKATKVLALRASDSVAIRTPAATWRLWPSSLVHHRLSEHSRPMTCHAPGDRDAQSTAASVSAT